MGLADHAESIKTHPCFSNLIKPALERVDAAHIYCFLVQTIRRKVDFMLTPYSCEGDCLR